MIEFDYIIRDPQGFHARPAGKLVKLAQECESEVSISLGDKTANAKRLFGVMGLCAKSGDSVTFRVEGEKEVLESEKLQALCRESL